LNEEGEKRRGRRREERGERGSINFINIILIRIAIMEPSILGSTVASDDLRKHIGSMLWDVFCNFLDIFPTYREENHV
jgi:hypothetical protein